MFAKCIWALMNTSSLPEIQGRMHYVLNGGAHIHHIPWIRGSTSRMSVHSTLIMSEENMEMHLSLLFDGYEGISTKDMTHQRRAKGRIGPTLTFTEDMAVTAHVNFVNMLSFLI